MENLHTSTAVWDMWDGRGHWTKMYLYFADSSLLGCDTAFFWGWVVPNISKNCPHDSVTLQNTWNSIRLLWEPQILYLHIAFVRLKRVSQVHICIQTWTGGRRKLCLSSVTLDILSNYKKHPAEFCRVFLGKTVIQQVKIFTASNLKDHNKS